MERPCLGCREPFVPETADQRYCEEWCKEAHEKRAPSTDTEHSEAYRKAVEAEIAKGGPLAEFLQQPDEPWAD